MLFRGQATLSMGKRWGETLTRPPLAMLRGLDSRFRSEARGDQISVSQCLCGRTCDTGFFNLGKI